MEPSQSETVATLAPVDPLADMLRGYRVSQAIVVASELGLADLLADGPRHVDELATKTNTHAPSLLRLLRALASLGIFRETSDGGFALTRVIRARDAYSVIEAAPAPITAGS